MKFFEREVRRVLEQKESTDGLTEAGQRARLAALDLEIAHLTAAAAAGLLSPPVRARLEAPEAERATLRTLGPRSEAKVASLATRLPKLAEHYRGWSRIWSRRCGRTWHVGGGISPR